VIGLGRLLSTESSQRGPERLLLPAHDDLVPGARMQWWYWCGHLATEAGRRFAYVAAFFAGDLGGGLVGCQMAHLVVLDVERGRCEARVEYLPWLPPRDRGRRPLATLTGSVSALRTAGGERITGRAGPLAIDLSLAHGGRSPLVHWGGARRAFSFGGDSLYYSRPQLATEGRVTVDGRAHAVRGRSWFDRQIGSLAESVLNGWRWFSVNLDDGSALVVFDFHHAPEERTGALVAPDGTARALGPGDVEIETLDRWRSPRTLAQYPSRWRLSVRGGPTLFVTPLVADQEVAKPWLYPTYWEGACGVTGDATGDAFVELVGYAEPLRTFGNALARIFPLW